MAQMRGKKPWKLLGRAASGISAKTTSITNEADLRPVASYCKSAAVNNSSECAMCCWG
jgi:hypothetical protein